MRVNRIRWDRIKPITVNSSEYWDLLLNYIEGGTYNGVSEFDADVREAQGVDNPLAIEDPLEDFGKPVTKLQEYESEFAHLKEVLANLEKEEEYELANDVLQDMKRLWTIIKMLRRTTK